MTCNLSCNVSTAETDVPQLLVDTLCLHAVPFSLITLSSLGTLSVLDHDNACEGESARGPRDAHK